MFFCFILTLLHISESWIHVSDSCPSTSPFHCIVELLLKLVISRIFYCFLALDTVQTVDYDCPIEALFLDNTQGQDDAACAELVTVHLCVSACPPIGQGRNAITDNKQILCTVGSDLMHFTLTSIMSSAWFKHQTLGC